MVLWLALVVLVLLIVLVLTDDWHKIDDPAGWDGVSRKYLHNGRSVGYDARGNKIEHDPNRNPYN
jgi:hypothetical protein